MKPLRFHQRLAAPVRATRKVRQARASSVESANDHLGVVGRLLDRSIAEVDYLLGMTQGPGCVDTAAARVAVVGAGRGIATRESVGEGTVRDRSREAAVT